MVSSDKDGNRFIVCKDESAKALEPYGDVIGLPSFSLPNSGAPLLLEDTADRLIHYVHYEVNWYKDNDKAEGGWSLGIYLDEKGSPEAHDALTKIFKGEAGGSISWFSIMIAEYLGAKVVPITFEERDIGWYLGIPKIIDGAVEPVMGADGVTPVMAKNTNYWAGVDVVVSKGTKSRIRDWGRNWDLSGQSAEYARVDWVGP